MLCDVLCFAYPLKQFVPGMEVGQAQVGKAHGLACAPGQHAAGAAGVGARVCAAGHLRAAGAAAPFALINAAPQQAPCSCEGIAARLQLVGSLAMLAPRTQERPGTVPSCFVYKIISRYPGGCNHQSNSHGRLQRLQVGCVRLGSRI